MVIILCIISLYLVSQTFFINRDLEIVFIDVGQGDATLIQTPMGKNILIDTGTKNDLGNNLSKYIPDSRRSIDLLILTHPDLDHIGGTMSVLDEFEVHSFMHSGLLAGIPLYGVIADAISEKNIPVYEAIAGQRINIEPNISMDIYSPHENIESFDANEYSIVMHVHYGEHSFLITGDASKLIESDIAETYGELISADILKVGHHGSQTSTLDSFVEMVNPQYAIISAGCDNRFGHPHPKVLTTLFQNRVEILETCNEGDIIFSTDGTNLIQK